VVAKCGSGRLEDEISVASRVGTQGARSHARLSRRGVRHRRTHDATSNK
jgi:hypothetical protein